MRYSKLKFLSWALPTGTLVRDALPPQKKKKRKSSFKSLIGVGFFHFGNSGFCLGIKQTIILLIGHDK